MFNFAFDFKWGRGAKKGGAVGAEGRQHATLRHWIEDGQIPIINELFDEDDTERDPIKLFELFFVDEVIVYISI